MDYEALLPVAAWLEAGEAADYQDGVLLLQQYCRNRNLVSQLIKKESAAHREKLTYELLKLGTSGDLAEVSELYARYTQAVAEAVQGAVPSRALEAPLAEQPAPGDEVPEALRPEVDALTETMGKVYRERCQFSNSLVDLDPAEGPCVVAQILSLEQQYNALATKRRNLLANPQAPAAKAEAPAAADEPTAPGVDRAELTTRRNTLRSGISKTKGKLASAQTETKRSELTQKLAKLEVEVTNVELQLRVPQG